MSELRLFAGMLVFVIAFLVIGLIWILFGNSNAVNAPVDVVKEEQILVYPDRIEIRVSGASMSRYEPTGSMRPVLDKGANGIRVKPGFEGEVNVGDIVTFKQGDALIVHRVIEKGKDNKGVYFITKGDNNVTDDGKIRFSQIEYITIGIIY